MLQADTGCQDYNPRTKSTEETTEAESSFCSLQQGRMVQTERQLKPEQPLDIPDAE
jgi:hypothetical protein